MSEDRSEGLLVRAQPLEQAEHISRLMVDVRVANGVLLLDADPAWAEAINTVLATKGVRVSELCPIRNSKLEPPTPRDHSVPRGIEARERTATGLIRTGTQWTKLLRQIIENRRNKRNYRTHQYGPGRAHANS